MFYLVLILINLFFVLGANAVKDAPEINAAQWGVFQEKARKRPMTLKDTARCRYNTFRLRGVNIPLPNVRAAEIRFLRPYLEAEDLHALENVWRDNHPIGSSPRYPADRPVSESRRLITKAFATMRIAGILAIEGYKPSGDNLVPWRNFVVEKLKEIRDGTIDSTEAKDQHVWKTNQRHAHTYIGLILADIGNHGLHEDAEDKQVLFQEAWDSFNDAEKISQSKRLPLFKAYLMKIKKFTPAGYDETSKETEIQRLWTQYNTHRHNSYSSDVRRRSTATDDATLARVAGPGTKRDRHTPGASLATQLEAEIQASLAALIHQDPNDGGAAGAGGFSPRSESDSDTDDNGDDDAPGHLPGDTQTKNLSEESNEGRREDRHPVRPPLPSSRNTERAAFFDAPSSRAIFSGHTLQTSKLTEKTVPPQQGMELTGRIYVPETRIHDPLLSSLQSDGEFSKMTDSLATDFRIRRMDDVVPKTPLPPLSLHTAAEGRVPSIFNDEVADKSLFMSLEKQRTKTTSRVDSSPVPMPSNEGDFARDMEERSTGASGETQTMDDDVEEAEDANNAQTMDSSEDSEDESESDDERDQKRSQKAEARAGKRASEKQVLSVNAQLDHYIESNKESVKNKLKSLRETKATVTQLVSGIEEMAGLKFTTIRQGAKRVHEIIGLIGKITVASPFAQYLKTNEDVFSTLIPKWIQEAKETGKELSTRNIAEAIASYGKLEGSIQEQQLEYVKVFLRSHQITNDSRKQTAADVLRDQDEAVINQIFQDFHAQFLKDLKSRKFLKDLKYGEVLKDFDDGKKPLKTKHFVPLLIETLEQFAGQRSQGTPLKFRSEKVGRHYIENLLRTLELELPGKYTKSSMTAFLLDKNNLPLIREIMLEIAPLLEKPSMTYTKASKLFETRLSERTGEDLSFEGDAGAKRMRAYFKKHIETTDGKYHLKPLPQKEKKRIRTVR